MFNLEETKRKMLVKYPFFGSVISNITFKETKGVSTAATNGEVIVYNEDFMNTLPEKNQVFVLAHEAMHIAFNHIKRGKNKNHEVWNIATDAVINSFLKKDGFEVREDFVYYEDAINFNAEQYYEKLMKELPDNQKNKNNQNGQSQGNQNSNSSGSMSNNHANTSHEYWYKPFDEKIKKDLEKKSNENKKQNENKNQGENPLDEEQKDSAEINIDKENEEKKKKQELEEAKDEITKKEEKESFKENNKIKKEAYKKLRDELVKKSQAGDTTTSDIIDNLNIGAASKYIDWRLLLKEAVNLDVDWSYENATIEEGVVTPHIEEIMKPETEIVLDTSGSIDEQLLINFLKECKNIISTSKVKVGCFDTMFYGFQEVRNEKEIEKLEFRGGGGTNFDVAVNAFSKRVENKIIFTDGRATMPKMPLDAIWVVFGAEKIKPKGGRVIYIDEEQLNKLKLAQKVFKA